MSNFTTNLGRNLSTLIILGSLLIFIGLASQNTFEQPAKITSPTPASDHITSGALEYMSDSALTTLPGSGIATNPYVIANYAVTGNSYCIHLENTQKYVIIVNCLFALTGDGEGIDLKNASNVAVLNNTFWGLNPSYTGMFVWNCTNVTISGNYFTNITSTGNECGIDIYG
jgi:hypothetical protein